MPIGFNVESGADLSDRLLKLAPIILKKLKNGREAETITPSKPISAATLCHWVGEYHNDHLEGPHIRAIVNYLRRNHEPIASEAEGYFYALGISELDLTLQHLRQRAGAINSAIHGLEHSFDREDGQIPLI